MAQTFRISNIPTGVSGEDLLKNLTDISPRVSAVSIEVSGENKHLSEIHGTIAIWPYEGASCHRYVQSSTFISAGCDAWISTAANTYNEWKHIIFFGKL